VGESDGEGAILCVQARAGKNLHTYRMLMPDDSVDVLEVPLFNEGRAFALKVYNEAGSRFSVQGGMQLLYDVRMRTI